jgi:hypothetical protein
MVWREELDGLNTTFSNPVAHLDQDITMAP